MSIDTAEMKLQMEAAQRAAHRARGVDPLWTGRRLTILGFIIGCLIGLIILVGTWTAVGALHNCYRIQRIDNTIQQIEVRALHVLGTPGSTGFAYYKAHPAELVQARKDAARSIKDFNPPSCSLPF